MFRFLLLTITLLLLLSTVSALRAESLWQPGVSKSDCADKRATKVGDIVTIIIVESATASSSASTDTKKDSSLKAGPGLGPLLKEIPAFSYSGGDSMKADGSTTRSSKFVAKITATVTKIDESGNLCVEGSRIVQTNKEREQIKLSGVIRKEDIATDNTILSTYIANATITYQGSGPLGSRQKEGIISKIFKILF